LWSVLLRQKYTQNNLRHKQSSVLLSWHFRKNILFCWTILKKFFQFNLGIIIRESLIWDASSLLNSEDLMQRKYLCLLLFKKMGCLKCFATVHSVKFYITIKCWVNPNFFSRMVIFLQLVNLGKVMRKLFV
jgi:hypothetical protein